MSQIFQHEIKKVRIEELSQGGDGIARAENFVIFVPYSAPGDELGVKIVEKHKNFAKAEIVKILNPSKFRTSAPCPYYFTAGAKEWCGGCNLQHLSYLYQTEIKTKVFRNTLQKLGHFSEQFILPALTVQDEGQWKYRNKIQIPFGVDPQSKIISGFFKPKSHQIIPIQACLIHSEKMMEIVRFVNDQMNSWKIKSYSQENHKGWLRHLYIREESWSNKMLLTFVTLDPSFPRKEEWIKILNKEFPQILGICQNINPEKTNVILGRSWKFLWGQNYLTEKLQGLRSNSQELILKISAGSFFQVNTAMANKLYQVIQQFVLKEGEKPDTVLDLYCGVGGIALSLAESCKKVIGVDEVPSSISDAKENSKLNFYSDEPIPCQKESEMAVISFNSDQRVSKSKKIPSIDFFCKDVYSFLKRFKKEWGKSLTFVLDPPRSGVAPEVLAEIVRLRAEKIVMVSCEASSLARDLKFLCSTGYGLKKIQPVDLFPQSSHIESVSLLSLQWGNF
ncbi:MAG: 23S rRNA (uracil-5-)-methyltransferase RumA [Elusimicrobia bacterium RIFCSPLOWO2_02_FULL_39_32]|nr:MAG: 23S rRNA (uracil-5-)-methyltransferase RumA [Elusimicrobia bacterium GWA2_38_7]OGR80417.1 MAG: 23S rRNA (uracil-5-)-methyltransferase RumA [Elusimicrobia bacterium RIFCSPHIGHO2_02_FULL_39_36]OGR93299.1 MAG: 23S rRNA (uracil-5-)-methyltransferase RumA [Elusimicrobia bacterium RIFCSPLOWO2_02_FULL_39_32]OGS00529.1 MAG: 23S rRNA (uracil-5-)-methyltransferase RumA [Elusimicrobia bacterium RIFCSPLOWO2_12_FULL_39_28]